MIATANCDVLTEHMGAYVEGTLPEAEARALDRHVGRCVSCQESLDHFRAVKGLIEFVRVGQTAESRSKHAPEPEQDEPVPAASPLWHRMAGAPWWFVSCCLHILVIALAGLVSMAIDLPRSEDTVIMMTELQPRPVVQETEKEKTPSEVRDALESKSVDATDPTSKEASNIEVPPDILAKAQLGDHFETINPDRPDTQSAYGNPDAMSYHSMTGNAEAAGGGGMGGVGMEDLIGVGGAASRGTGGGFGGGDGTGTGVGSGAGHGSFGSRNGGGRKLMVRKHGGSPATENAVNKALEWLAYHQEPDGHWDVKKYQGTTVSDAGITGLALLAFLGAGHSERTGQYKNNVKRAVAWIISQQEADGNIGGKFKEPWHPGHAYHHAMCGLALAEAAAMGQIKTTIEAAQKAVDYSCEIHQKAGVGASDKFAWRYDPKSVTNDTSVSGWFVMQLKSAKVAGLHVDPASLEGALKFYDSCESKKEYNGYKGGRFGYTGREDIGTNTCAIGMLCNLFLGRQPGDLMGGAEYLGQNLPKWDPKLGQGGLSADHHFPMYYTYYGTLTMFQMGRDQWKPWNKALQEMLLPTQQQNGDAAGSWDPIGGNDDVLAGRVYMTAMGALCLEVYYRYQKLGQ